MVSKTKMLQYKGGDRAQIHFSTIALYIVKIKVLRGDTLIILLKYTY